MSRGWLGRLGRLSPGPSPSPTPLPHWLWWKRSLLIFLLLASNHCQLSLLSILRMSARPHSCLSSFLEVIIPPLVVKAAHRRAPAPASWGTEDYCARRRDALCAPGSSLPTGTRRAAAVLAWGGRRVFRAASVDPERGRAGGRPWSRGPSAGRGARTFPSRGRFRGLAVSARSTAPGGRREGVKVKLL